ncbi:Non-specific lipid transfer protein GPI-anchored 10 [Linum perenne]
MVWLLLLLVRGGSSSQQQAPTISECNPGLLQLTPCSPYVKGISPSPIQSCCDDLIQLYKQQPECLCLIITTPPNLGGFPINTTLAMQLPSLCGLHLNHPSGSTTSAGALSPASPLARHANSSLPRNPNSTAPSTAVVQITPRPVIMGMGRSSRVGLCRQVFMTPLLWCLFHPFLQQ